MIFQSVFFLVAACYGSFIHSLFLKDVSFPISSYLQEIHMEEKPGKCSSLAEIELVCEFFLPFSPAKGDTQFYGCLQLFLSAVLCHY